MKVMVTIRSQLKKSSIRKQTEKLYDNIYLQRNNPQWSNDEKQ